MPDLPTQTLLVLSSALNLGSFTMPQLATASGASYETVKRTLGQAEKKNSVRRTGAKVAQGKGRPAEVWEVQDREAIQSRLAEVGELARSFDADSAPAADEQALEAPESHLARAEDTLLFALRASDPTDVGGLVAEALTALDDAGLGPDALDLPTAGADTLVQPQNLPTRQARAQIVAAIAEYLESDEAAGLAGPLWRRAFQALTAAELPQQAGLQNRFLVQLVRIADERESAPPSPFGLPPEQLVEVVAHVMADPEQVHDREALYAQLDHPAARDAIGAAVAQIVVETACGDRSADAGALENLLDLVRAAFERRDKWTGTVHEPLVDGLRALALGADQESAAQAQETLLAIHQPRDESFWRQTAEAPGVSRGTVFEGLSQTSIESALTYLREELDADPDAVADVQQVLRESLPTVAQEAGLAAQAAFGDFLAEVPEHARSQLIAVPALAGLEWPVSRFERPLARRFQAKLLQWRTFLQGGHRDAPAVNQLEELGGDVRKLGGDVFAVLDPEEQRRATYALASQARERAGAAVAVPLLLAANREGELAHCLIETKPPGEETWQSTVRWYLDVCPREDLDVSLRCNLVNALRSVLVHDETAFLMGLAQAEQELPELMDNPGIDSEMRFQLEVVMTGSYSGAVADLYGAAAGDDEAALSPSA